MDAPKQIEIAKAANPPVLAPPVMAPPKLPPVLPVKATKWPAWIFVVCGIVSGVVAAVVILVLGFAISPARMGAQAAFTIDWNKMPGASDDGEATRMRKVWREVLAAYMSQEQGDSEARAIVSEINHQSLWDLISATKKPPVLPDEAAAIASIKRNLRVTTASISEREDQVVVQMSDADTNRALVVVRCVVNKRLSDVALHKVVGSLVAANFNQESQDIEKRMDSIRKEIWSLSAKMRDGDRSLDTSRRYRELEQELTGLSNQRDFNQAKQFFGVLDSPINVTEPAHVVLGSGDFRAVWFLFATASAAAFFAIGSVLAWRAAKRRQSIPQ